VLLEVARLATRYSASERPSTMEGAIAFFDEMQAREPETRRDLLLGYLRDIKYNNTIYGYGKMPYASYLELVANRAIKLWKLKEGSHAIRPSDLIPEGIVYRNDVDFEPIDCDPICGTVLSVISQLYAWRHRLMHHATLRAIKTDPSFEDDGQSYPIGKVARMGCVYYAGTLVITRDKDTYENLQMLADTYLHKSMTYS